MNPEIAVAISAIFPFIIAGLTKAQASNRLRVWLGFGLVAATTAATVAANNWPAEFDAIVAAVVGLSAIVAGAYQTIDGLMGGALNDAIFPEKGLG